VRENRSTRWKWIAKLSAFGYAPQQVERFFGGYVPAQQLGTFDLLRAQQRP
jgi:hypothetical protein